MRRRFPAHFFKESIVYGEAFIKIGIVCAAEKELVPFLPQIKDIKASEKAMLKFYEAMECCYHDVAENICTGRRDAQYEKKPSHRVSGARVS